MYTCAVSDGHNRAPRVPAEGKNLPVAPLACYKKKKKSGFTGASKWRLASHHDLNQSQMGLLAARNWGGGGGGGGNRASWPDGGSTDQAALTSPEMAWTAGSEKKGRGQQNLGHPRHEVVQKSHCLQSVKIFSAPINQAPSPPPHPQIF